MRRALKKGFTLIELIVVMIILGILAAVAVPQFIDLSAEARTAAFNSTCGAIQSSAVLLYASNRAGSPGATIIANTTFVGLEAAPTAAGCVISVQVKGAPAAQACPAVPAPLCP